MFKFRNKRNKTEIVITVGLIPLIIIVILFFPDALSYLVDFFRDFIDKFNEAYNYFK